MSLRVTFCAAIAALSAWACGGDEPRSPFGPSLTELTVTGRVRDYRTESPLAAAAVNFRLALSSEVAYRPSETVTAADGTYALAVPFTALYDVSVDGTPAGTVRVNGTGFRGDILVDRATCVARYGYIIDSRTLRPVENAQVTLTARTVTTNADGWYRFDLGCPDIILPGGTTAIAVTHPDYRPAGQVVGRGISAVRRLDLALQRR